MPNNLAVTTPVEKFWQKISTALAARTTDGSNPTCMSNGRTPPTVKRIKPVRHILPHLFAGKLTRNGTTDNTISTARMSSAWRMIFCAGTVSPPAWAL